MSTSYILAAGSSLNGRYVIKKIVEDTGSSRRYLARDSKVFIKSCIILELIPPPLHPDKLAHLRDAYLQAIESVNHFDQPSLVRVLDSFTEAGHEYVVMERVEAIGLQLIKDMSLGHLSELQVLPWLIQIARAIDYLHRRPRPFILDSLNIANIMLTSDEQIKLEACGFKQFFQSSPVAESTEDPRCIDYVRFGRLIEDLLQNDPNVDIGPRREAPWTDDLFQARPPHRAEEIPEAPVAGLRGDLVKLAHRCQVPREFQSFGEVLDLLEKLAEVPTPAAPGATRDETFSGFALPKWTGPTIVLPPVVTEKMSEGIRFLRQPMVLGINVFIVLLVAALTIGHPGAGYSKDGPEAYVVSGESELETIDARLRSIKDSKLLKNAVITDAKAVRDGHRLLLADGKNSRILVIDTETNEQKLEVTVDMQPQAMFLDKKQKYLYCTHARGHSISVVSLDSLEMVNVFGLPYTPTSLTVSPNGSLLYASCAAHDQVFILDAETGRIRTSFPVTGGPNAMLVTQDGRELWVACQQTDTVCVYALEAGEAEPSLTRVISSLQGRGPVALQMSTDLLTVFVLCQDSDSISLVSAMDKTVRATVPTGGTHPTSWSFMPGPSGVAWVANSGSSSVGLVDLTVPQLVKTLAMPGNPAAIEAVP